MNKEIIKELYKKYPRKEAELFEQVLIPILEARDKEIIEKINEIDEFGETYCERDEALFEAVKQEIINLIKQ